MSEYKYRSDRRLARQSSEERGHRRSPEHYKDHRYRQDKIRKSKWQKRSRSRSRSNHKQDKYSSHDNGSYKRQQKYNGKQTEYRSRDYDKRQSRYHEEDRWRETENKQKERNEYSRKRYDDDTRKVYERPRRDQDQKPVQRKESEKREKSFSERKRERSPSSHSLSSGKREARVDRQAKEDKRQVNTLSRQQTYKQNKDEKEEPKSRYIRRKDESEPVKRQTVVVRSSPPKQDPKRAQNIVERVVEKGEQQKIIAKQEKNDQAIKDKANNPAIISGLKFGVKGVFPPPPPKQKKLEEQPKRQPQKQIQDKPFQQRNQLPLKQPKIEKEIFESSPLKRPIEERIQNKPFFIPSKTTELKLQKTRFSKYQLMLSEARDNLQVAPPPTSFLILDTFRNMNKFYVETVDAKWANLLRHDLEHYDSFKDKTMSKLQFQGDEGAESRQWMWLKEERNQEQLDLKFKLQQLRQQGIGLNELVRKLRFID